MMRGSVKKQMRRFLPIVIITMITLSAASSYAENMPVIDWQVQSSQESSGSTKDESQAQGEGGQVLLTVYGQSMAPTLNENDVV